MNVKASLRPVVDIVVMSVLTVLALGPFSGAYDGLDYWIAGIGGVLLGAGIAALGRWQRWNLVVVAAAVVVAYFVFGSALAVRSEAIAGVVPSLDSLSLLALGVVQVWKRALTLPVPLDSYAGLAVAPFLLALVVSTIASSLAARLQRAWWTALIAPSALLLFSAAFSTYLGVAPNLLGALFLIGALGWAVWRTRLRRASQRTDAADAADASHARRGLGLALVAAVLAGAGVAGAGVAAVAAPAQRTVLRDQVVPPLDLHDYASPLTLFRRYTTDGADAKLFTIEGLPQGAAVRLATLDLYDGQVYKVSGGGGAGSGSFTRVGRSIATNQPGDPASVTVTVDSLTGVWMPTVGYLTTARFTGEGADAANAALHYNSATGTAVDVDGLRQGESYQFDTRVEPAPGDEELAAATIAAVTTPAPERLPDAVAAAVADATADAPTPYDQIKAVQAHLQQGGYFSNGLAGQVASRAGHGLSRESDLLGAEQMVGDDEQYSVAMALMLSQLGIPSRVVMGFRPAEGVTGPVTITAADVRAWVEVPFDGLGWVAFDATPAKDRVPEQITEQQKQKPQGQVVQPPQTPQEPAELPPAPPADDAGSNDQGASLAWLWATLRIVGSLGLVLLVLSAPSIVLIVAAARKRRARRAADAAADRMTGGWAEIVDAAGDVGTPISRGGTRRENADVLAEAYPDAGALALAVRADEAVFGAGDPSDAQVDAYWADVDSARERILRGAPRHRRLLARVLPRSGASTVRDAIVARWRAVRDRVLKAVRR